MKKWHLLMIAAAAAMATPAFGSDVHVNVTIGDPGYYGPLDIRGYPAPRLVYAQPVIIQRVPVVVQQPIYLRVPVYQQRNWSSYCGRYNACSRRVYFVQDTWYSDIYVPRYRTRTYQTYETYPNRTYQTYQSNPNYSTRNYSNYSTQTYSGQTTATQARANAKAAEADRKTTEKQAKADRKAAEKQAKEERKAAEKQAKADRKTAEKQAKLDQKLAHAK